MSSDENIIATRYVRALFDYAQEHGIKDNVKDDLIHFQQVLSESKELSSVLYSPVITRDQAVELLTSVLKNMHAHALTQKFFVLLAHNRRLATTSLIIQKYMELLAESMGEVTAHITSAAPLKEDHIATLRSALARATGKKIVIKLEENKALIGGLQVRVGSKLLDQSIAGSLSRLQLALKRAA